jgi:hypothetical protein
MRIGDVYRDFVDGEVVVVEGINEDGIVLKTIVGSRYSTSAHKVGHKATWPTANLLCSDYQLDETTKVKRILELYEETIDSSLPDLPRD